MPAFAAAQIRTESSNALDARRAEYKEDLEQKNF
jgi:hypothetical protein